MSSHRVDTQSRWSRLVRVGLGAAAVAGGLATAGCTTVPGGGAGSACTDVELVVARGTSEPGTLGTIVGDPLLRAARTAVAPASIRGQRVDYPAGFSADSPPAGNRAIVSYTTQRATTCPGTKFVLVGYSQGAQVVDLALGVDTTGTINGIKPVAVLPESVEPRIAAITLFGNPIGAKGMKVPARYLDRTLDLCAAGDPVCQPGGGNIAAHLTYNNQASRAAAFIASKVG
jgi:cutinase